jgi:hypothetical protein
MHPFPRQFQNFHQKQQAPTRLLSFARDKGHFLTLYTLQLPVIYPLPNILWRAA